MGTLGRVGRGNLFLLLIIKFIYRPSHRGATLAPYKNGHKYNNNVNCEYE